MIVNATALISSRRQLHSDRRRKKMMVTERCPEKVVGGAVGAKRNREESAGGAPALEWRVLESGVLAVKTPLNVVTVQGTRSIWFEPRKISLTDYVPPKSRAHRFRLNGPTPPLAHRY